MTDSPQLGVAVDTDDLNTDRDLVTRSDLLTADNLRVNISRPCRATDGAELLLRGARARQGQTRRIKSWRVQTRRGQTRGLRHGRSAETEGQSSCEGNCRNGGASATTRTRGRDVLGVHIAHDGKTFCENLKTGAVEKAGIT